MIIQPAGPIKNIRIGSANRDRLANNLSLQAAINGKNGSILKDPSMGFTAGNLKVRAFMGEFFVFSVDGQEMDQLGGRTLVRMWAKDPKVSFNERTIIETLRWIGVRIEGEDVLKASEADFQNDPYMRQAIENGKNLLLHDEARGFQEDNVNPAGFTSTFYFRDSQGALKRFSGPTLLRKRGLAPVTKENIVLLLKDVGIYVREALPAPFNLVRIINPSPREYSDNKLMRKAIKHGQGQFLDGLFSRAAFLSAFFSIRVNGITKVFFGKDLLEARGVNAKNEKKILALLGKLGIREKGRVKQAPPAPISVRPERSINDDQIIIPLLKTFVRRHREKVLMDVLHGFQPSNIVWQRVPNSFEVEHEGRMVTFSLKEILRGRGYRCNTNGLAGLLKELGIN